MISFILIGAVVVGLVEINSSVPKPVHPLSVQQTDRPIRDFDDRGGLTFDEDKPRIDRFAEEMKRNQSNVAYIIAYAGLVSYKNEAAIRLRCIRNHLVTAH